MAYLDTLTCYEHAGELLPCCDGDGQGGTIPRGGHPEVDLRQRISHEVGITPPIYVVALPQLTPVIATCLDVMETVSRHNIWQSMATLRSSRGLIGCQYPRPSKEVQ